MEIQMKSYYEFRNAVRKLYDTDVQIGDLCCKILEVRDKYRYIESINVSIQDYIINVELTSGTDDDKKAKVIDKIGSLIGYYLSDNQDLLPADIRNDPGFEIFLESENFIYCDIYVVGDSIRFTL